MNAITKDLSAVVDDAGKLLRHAGDQTVEQLADARRRLEDGLHAAQAQLQAAEHAVAAGARQAGRAAEGYVHRNPWTAIGIGVGIGLLAAALLSRR